MAANPDQFNQIEGQWDELIRHPDQFAGRRVRVTVLSDEKTVGSSMPAEIRRWLAEGDALEIAPLGNVVPSAFGDGLVEKFRKQGLVL
ncbi:MAG: hypothetical protein ABSB74_09805 [Tepidisphaeraceae bacterium]|jgi:hypothetical protein